MKSEIHPSMGNSMGTIKTVSGVHFTMTKEESLIEAWQSLEEHWIIPTTGKPLPSTPSYSFLRMFLSPFLRPMMNAKINGLHHIPRNGPVILAANHLSHVDPIFVIASARRTTHYLAKDGHFKNAFMRFAMRATGQIETKRDQGGEGALSSAADVLDSGQALGIFPEGTRSKRNERPYLLPGKTGIARLAASYPDAVVVPMALMGTRKMMKPQDHKAPRLWRPIALSAGKGVTWMEWLQDPKGGDTNAQQLVHLSTKEEHEIRASLASLYRKFTNQLMGSISALGAP
jgi:1-acyl-sn-glycerol-3-phosphate acyltransferase